MLEHHRVNSTLCQMDKAYLLYNNNGTAQIVNIESPSPVAEAVIIIICYLFGVGYNFIIIITVLYRNYFRTSTYHLLLFTACFTCLLDCLTNQSIAFGFLFNNRSSWCWFSATVFHFFLLNHSSSLSLLLLERILILKDHLISIRVALAQVLVSWIFGLTFVLPMFRVSEVYYFPNRNACGAVNTHLWFSAFSMVGFLLVFGLIGMSVFELSSYTKRYLRERKLLDVLSIFPSSSNEIQNSILPLTSCCKNRTVCIVLFLYILLLLPLIISFSVSLFLTATFEPNPWLDPRTPSDKTRSVLTNPLEPLYTYSRYMYNAIVPIIILSTNRDIRLQSRQVFCFRKNVISNFDQSLTSGKSVNEQNTPRTASICLGTPVLFATSRGLHLRTVQSNKLGYQEVESSSDSKSNTRFLTSFCDLTVNSNLERSSYGLRETVKVSEGHSRIRRCVRFSSQVDTISAPETRSSWNSAESAAQSDQSLTHTIKSPIFIKESNLVPSHIGDTYNVILP